MHATPNQRSQREGSCDAHVARDSHCMTCWVVVNLSCFLPCTQLWNPEWHCEMSIRHVADQSTTPKPFKYITCLRGSAWQVVVGHVRFKGKAWTPSARTDDRRITKIGLGYFGLKMTPFAKFGSDRFRGARAAEPPFHVDFGFYFIFFLSFFDRTTNRTVEAD
jgi:hypothetical protein